MKMEQTVEIHKIIHLNCLGYKAISSNKKNVATNLSRRLDQIWFYEISVNNILGRRYCGLCLHPIQKMRFTLYILQCHFQYQHLTYSSKQTTYRAPQSLMIPMFNFLRLYELLLKNIHLIDFKLLKNGK